MTKTIQLSAIVTATILVAGLIGVSFTDEVFAKKEDKVEVCHVNSANDGPTPFAAGVIFWGKVISVSPNAVPEHEANHGDSTVFFGFDEDMRDFFEEAFGISLPNANCGIFVPN